MKLSRLLLPILLASPLTAAPSAVDEILAAFQTKVESGGDVTELTPSIENLPSPEQKQLVAEIEKLWPRLRDAYLNDLTAAARNPGGKKGANRAEIQTHRNAFREVYAKDEAAMKPLLSSTSMPAVVTLRKLLSPTPDDLVATANPKLKTQRHLARSLATFRDATLNAALSTTPADSLASLEAAERAAAEAASGFDRNDLKILAQNRKTARDKDVPEDEARGIEECNEWRMLVGLRALILDPKLCEAARGHSKDMREHGFFAHESPLPGKRTPWDRARLAGTSASGENIFMGGNDPRSANTGWFYSPGHHKNMFSPGPTRIGLGRDGSHWTQLFGN